MTAPADVWAVEVRPGTYINSGGHEVRPPHLFINEGDAANVAACYEGAHVVRFRLVRVDEPAVGQDHWRHAANEWADRLCDVVPLLDLIGSGTMDVGTAISEVRTWIARCRESQPASPDAEPAAQRDEVGDRDEVGELRECVRELSNFFANVAWLNLSHTERTVLTQIIDRLAAQSGPAGEVGDG